MQSAHGHVLLKQKLKTFKNPQPKQNKKTTNQTNKKNL